VYPDRDLASDARGPTLRTQRLVLRRWRAEDLAPFAELNADPDVMAHMQRTMSREESDAFVARIEEEFDDCGFGLWAVEAPNRRSRMAPSPRALGLWIRDRGGS
jgi:RimJ/RimL family protein N-acetyltransferase